MTILWDSVLRFRFVKLAMVVLLLQVSCGCICGAVIDRTIAKINDDILTESDLAEVTADANGQFKVGSTDAFAVATSETVMSMFDRALLLQEARRLKISATTDELNDQVEGMVRDIRAKFSSEKEFHQALASERISLDQLKQDLIKKTKTDFQVYHVINSRYSISDKDVETYTTKMQGEGGALSSYRMRRLGIAVTKKCGEQCATEKAREAVNLIIRRGISFEEGVRKYSEVPGAEADAGDLGYMSADKLNSQVLEAVEKLEPGQATKPIVAGGFVNIFYLEGKRGAKSAVRERKFFEARQELLQQLRRKAILQVFDSRLTALMPQDYRQCVVGGMSPMTLSGPREGAPQHGEGHVKEQGNSSNVLTAPPGGSQSGAPYQQHYAPAAAVAMTPVAAPAQVATPTPRPRGLFKMFGRRE